MFDELEYLVQRCGLTPSQALEASSRNGALAIGAEQDMGTLEPGKLANFVVLGEDPTTDLAALRTITDVVKRGRRHRRADYVHPARPAANGAAA